MTAYTLSVVQLCPDAYREQANSIAAAYGYGDGNLSVELRHVDGSTWWGCHAWWIPEALAAAINPPDGVTGNAEIMAQVITKVVYVPPGSDATGVGNAHWRAALSANDLSVPEPANA